MALAAEGLRVLLEPIPDLTKPHLLTQRGLLFQCPPLEEFAIDYAHSHTDYDTLSEQHSRSGVPQLATVSFDTLLVDYATFTVNPNIVQIEDVTATLRRLLDAGSPFLFTAAHQLPSGGYSNWSETLAGPEIQMPATLRSMRVSEKAGEGDARYVNISFVEYRDATISRKSKGKRRPGRRLPTTVRLYWDGVAEDRAGNKIGKPPAHPLTLALLAKTFYKDPTLGHFIAQANGLGNWGTTDQLIGHPRFAKLKHGKFGKIKIPKRGHRSRQGVSSVRGGGVSS